MIRHLALAATLALAPLVGFAADDITELNFGIVSTESSSNLKPSWDPLLADMSKAIGIPVKAFFASEYAGVIEGMRFKKVDVGWFGNKSAMEAVDRSDGTVFAKCVNKDGSEGYYSLGIVHVDSPFHTIDELLAKRSELNVGMGDANSTSGTLVPGFYIYAKNHIDPMKDFKRALPAKHEANILAVASKQVDFATVASDVLERVHVTAPEKAAMVRVIWKSPLIASDPLVWRNSLPEALKGKIKDFFVNYGKSENEKKILLALTWSGFRASSNDQLIPIRQLAQAKLRSTVEADATMSAADKQAKFAEIDKKLAELEAQAAALAQK